jgi:outer membrane lipoprotein SlyB
MKRNAVLVGGGALLGTIVGAIAGGGKGAGIGAATGAVAGGAGAVATGKKEILIPAETVMTFRVRDQLILD